MLAKKKARLPRASALVHKKVLCHNSASFHPLKLELERWLPLRIRVRMYMLLQPIFSRIFYTTSYGNLQRQFFGESLYPFSIELKVHYVLKTSWHCQLCPDYVFLNLV